MKSIVREIGGASLIVVLAASILLGENPPILNAVSEVSCVVTQTDDGFSWQLVLTKNSRVAALKGSAHELLIEERVAKQR